MHARRKVWVEGSRPDIRVPFAEVELTGDNPPVRLYDTSGPGSPRSMIHRWWWSSTRPM